ncbi:MAG: hypothetical protein V3T99_00385 [Nitrososphaerales archaeon]
MNPPKIERDSAWSERLSFALLAVLTIIVIALSAADLSGLLDAEWFDNRLPTISLLAIGVVLLAMLIERHTSISNLARELAVLRRSALLKAELLNRTAILLQPSFMKSLSIH